MTGHGDEGYIAEMASRMIARSERPNLVNQLAISMMKTWGRVDPPSSVSRYPASYVANFADMAKALIQEFDIKEKP